LISSNMTASQKRRFAPCDVAVVILTYSDRWQLLKETLSAALAQGAGRAIVVDNCSARDIAGLAGAEFGNAVLVLRSDRNMGSSAGYGLGMKTASQLPGAELILLLDDDNKPQPGCLENLCAAFNEKAGAESLDNFALLAFRDNCPPSADTIIYSTFLLFHLRGLAAQVKRQIPFLRQSAVKLACRWQRVPWTTYGGFFFHRGILKRHGLPDARFVLYADDLEYTYRITAAGGGIYFIPEAQIVHTGVSWDKKVPDKFARRLFVLLKGSDYRIFYQLRNLAYFDSHFLCRSRIMREINRAVYLGLLSVLGLCTGKLKRLRLVWKAVHRGEQGLLGESPDFPLEQPACSKH